MGLIIQLTKSELAACKQAAALRWQLARMSGVVNQRRDSRSDDAIDYLGIRAEQALAKAYKLPYSPSALGIDAGVDMFCGDMSIDVKSTFINGEMLLAKSKEAVRADVLFLVREKAEELLELVGWIRSSRFLEEAEKKDLGHGPGWMVHESRLARPSQFWEMIVSREHGVAA